MKINTQTQTVLAIGGVIVAIGFLARKQLGGAVDAVSNINEGSDFEGSGPIGTLGNAVDTTLFGLPSAVGSAIGEFFSSNIFDTRTLDDLTGT